MSPARTEKEQLAAALLEHTREVQARQDAILR
jgi:hypothetical protein